MKYEFSSLLFCLAFIASIILMIFSIIYLWLILDVASIFPETDVDILVSIPFVLFVVGFFMLMFLLIMGLIE